MSVVGMAVLDLSTSSAADRVHGDRTAWVADARRYRPGSEAVSAEQ